MRSVKYSKPVKHSLRRLAELLDSGYRRWEERYTLYWYSDPNRPAPEVSPEMKPMYNEIMKHALPKNSMADLVKSRKFRSIKPYAS